MPISETASHHRAPIMKRLRFAKDAVVVCAFLTTLAWLSSGGLSLAVSISLFVYALVCRLFSTYWLTPSFLVGLIVGVWVDSIPKVTDGSQSLAEITATNLCSGGIMGLGIGFCIDMLIFDKANPATVSEDHLVTDGLTNGSTRRVPRPGLG